VQSFVRPSPRAQSLSNSSGKIFGLNSVGRNIIGTKHGQTMEVPDGLWMNIDLHNFERLIGIEILAPTSEIGRAPERIITGISLGTHLRAHTGHLPLIQRLMGII
jgi:hypothetical protein